MALWTGLRVNLRKKDAGAQCPWSAIWGLRVLEQSLPASEIPHLSLDTLLLFSLGRSEPKVGPLPPARLLSHPSKS